MAITGNDQVGMRSRRAFEDPVIRFVFEDVEVGASLYNRGRLADRPEKPVDSLV